VEEDNPLSGYDGNFDFLQIIDCFYYVPLTVIDSCGNTIPPFHHFVGDLVQQLIGNMHYYCDSVEILFTRNYDQCWCTDLLKQSFIVGAHLNFDRS
jgi:hypothetical protein